MFLVKTFRLCHWLVYTSAIKSRTPACIFLAANHACFTIKWATDNLFSFHFWLEHVESICGMFFLIISHRNESCIFYNQEGPDNFSSFHFLDWTCGIPQWHVSLVETFANPSLCSLLLPSDLLVVPHFDNPGNIQRHLGLAYTIWCIMHACFPIKQALIVFLLWFLAWTCWMIRWHDRVPRLHDFLILTHAHRPCSSHYHIFLLLLLLLILQSPHVPHFHNPGQNRVPWSSLYWEHSFSYSFPLSSSYLIVFPTSITISHLVFSPHVSHASNILDNLTSKIYHIFLLFLISIPVLCQRSLFLSKPQFLRCARSRQYFFPWNLLLLSSLYSAYIYSFTVAFLNLFYFL